MSKIAIIGLGYVGLPLAQLFLQKNHTVYGIDYDTKKVQSLQLGKSYLSDFDNQDIERMIQTGNFYVGSSYNAIKEADVIIMCVPTPLSEHSTPDISYIKKAIQQSVPFLKTGQLIVLESSTYPGTTEEIIVPPIEEKGFQIGKDLYVAYSPERIDPGQKQYSLAEIPKIVGGVTSVCTEKAKAIYETIFDQVVTVSSAKVAELSKLVENTQRLINISFMNELAMFCDQLEGEKKIDLWEVIMACSTKPFGFTPYYPGPGIGGHCIPVDPHYLLWTARQHNINLTLIEKADQINRRMPDFVVDKLKKHLNKPLAQSKILVIGLTYKKDVNDTRESRALDVVSSLLSQGAKIEYHDPHIPMIVLENQQFSSVPLTPAKLKENDCTLILTDHTQVPYQMIVEESNLIVDTRNVTADFRKLGKVIVL